MYFEITNSMPNEMLLSIFMIIDMGILTSASSLPKTAK